MSLSRRPGGSFVYRIGIELETMGDRRCLPLWYVAAWDWEVRRQEGMRGTLRAV